MLDFPRSVIEEILQCETIELGRFNERGSFESQKTLTKDGFDIYLTDVLYVDECEGEKVKITLGDSHVTKDKELLKDKDIFYKNYGWSYEKECRLIVRLTDKKSVGDYDAVRIKLSPAIIKKLTSERLYRSPVFTGGVSVGKESALTGRIEWDIL